ncbi:unnamed protein product [Lactuca virosa]|uniref:Uncharacterized protein n=1 Tax=Lactuca virosa TaxID=75947 RepID=A0AAU9P2K0_9ASTR|nr:unnamed protein product [Lactuca virosa]
MEKSKITDLEQQRSKKDGGSVREDKVSGGGRFGRKKEMERWKHRTRIALENRRRTHDDEVSEEEEFRTVEVKKENIESPIEIHSSKSMKKPIDISSSNSWKKKKARNNVYEYVYSSMKKRKHDYLSDSYLSPPATTTPGGQTANNHLILVRFVVEFVAVFEGLQAPYLLKSITSRNLHFQDTTSLPGLTLTGASHSIATKFLIIKNQIQDGKDCIDPWIDTLHECDLCVNIPRRSC